MFGIFKKKLKNVVKKIAEKISGEKEELPEEHKTENEKPNEISTESSVEKNEGQPTVEKEHIEKEEDVRMEKNDEQPPAEKNEGQPSVEESAKEISKEISKEQPSNQASVEEERPESAEESVVEQKEEESEVEQKEEKREEAFPAEEQNKVSKKPDEKVESKKSEVEQEKTQKEAPDDKKKEYEEKSFFKRLINKIVEKKISEDDFDSIVSDLKITLLQNDVALEVVEKITDDLKKNLVGKSVKRGKVADEILSSMKKSLEEILDQKWIDVEDVIKSRNANGEPALILFVGFNGVGKTTTLAKIGNMLKKKGYKVVFAAGDTFRAASIEQINYHGETLGIPVIKHDYGADSAAVIFDAVKHAKSKGYNVVLADTAGRSHSNVNLMDELKKIVRVNKPDLKILVIDSLTGNDAIEQAKRFDEAVGIDGIILTKFDVNDRGGAAISVGYVTKKPILYFGVGQEYDDIEKFNPKSIVDELIS